LENNGIKASIIGKITKDPKKIMYDGNNIISIDQPEADELFKVVGAHI